MARLFVELLDYVGPFHGGRMYFVAVLTEAGRYEAAYWVHPARRPVLELDAEARLGPEVFDRVYDEVLRALPPSTLLAQPTT